MLKVGQQEHFDKFGAPKAEMKLIFMRQDESQIFRIFLQKWELRLEYARGRNYLDSIKMINLQTYLSEKIRDEYAVLESQ